MVREEAWVHHIRALGELVEAVLEDMYQVQVLEQQQLTLPVEVVEVVLEVLPEREVVPVVPVS